MSDVPDESNLTKRERQKQRREAKRQEELRRQAKARRQRTLTFVLIGLILAGLIGAGVVRFAAQRRADREAEERAAAQLEEYGCQEAEPRDNLGAGHLDGNELATNPPEVLYPDRPATSGRHLGSVSLTGVYDDEIDERMLVHNLEHGYVNIFYGAGADESQVQELKTWAQEQIDGRFPKIIVSPWTASLSGEANFAYAAWDARQLCRDFSPDVALTFLNNHHGLDGTAPEKTVQAHTDPDQSGVANPRDVDGPLLFPPLGAGGPEPLEDAMEGTEAPTPGEPTPGEPTPEGDDVTPEPEATS